MNHTDSEQLHIPEILAPAGTYEAMEAAVNAGCDAVYLGGSLFSARAFAGNFDREEMLRAIDYCHLFGVRLYMTVNTLLKEQEISALVPYMQPFYEAGLDGVIIQDVGVARLLREHFPKLPLHASTQMSIASSYGAALLKQQGFTRVVPARELSLEELRAIKEKTSMEIETFVHGAMCYAYSGKCLFSSFLGGRSGNRGRCAQPCRKCYELSGTGAGSRIPPVKEYLMSLRDMCTLPVLPLLIDAGIDSFKIEGRMKNPGYVAATVNAYRTARDYYLQIRDSARKNLPETCRISASGTGNAVWENLSDSDRTNYQELAERLTGEMQDIYNRGGFCTGYYFQEKGPDMAAAQRPNHTGRQVGQITKVKGPDVFIRLSEILNEQDVLEILQTGTELTSNRKGRPGDVVSLKGKDLKKLKPGMDVYRTRNNYLLQQIEETILKPEKKISADARIRVRKGEPLQMVLKYDSVEITVSGNPVSAASSKPADRETLEARMRKTGGTHVDLQVSLDMDEDAFVPMSEFNQMRRDAVDQLKEAIAAQYRRGGLKSRTVTG